MAFIETSAFSGSGVLIQDGYVVTNAHVVWPFEKARVVFPDGSEFPDAPVLSWDLMGDLAVIGPLDTEIAPLELVNGEGLIIGSDVLLIGYPGEAEKFPQPTISRGLLSRYREWEAIEMTYFQTDAPVAGGQSGGVLVSEDGEVIGISGLFFTEAQFGLVASAADVLLRVEGLIAGEDVAGLGDRRLPKEGGKLQDDVTLDDQWDHRVYVLNEPEGADVSIRVEGANDAGFTLIDVLGNALEMDENTSGLEFGSATTQLAAPYFLWVWQNSDEPGDLRVTIDRNMVPYHDADDAARITVGQTLSASMDYPADLDYFVIELIEGETVEITADSVNIDPLLIVSFPGATSEQFIADDDSGGGIFGLNPELTYRAPHSGSYFIVILDANQAAVGGYFLTVAQAPEGAAAVSPPEAAPTIDSPFGPMALYESEIYPVSIQYPADWMEQPVTPEAGLTALYLGEQNEEFAIAEEEVAALGLGPLTLSEYVDAVLSVLSTVVPGYELISRQQTVTAQGLQIEMVEISALGGLQIATRLIYLDEDQIAFSATYTTPKARLEELKELIDYSFGTLQVEEAPDAEPAEMPTAASGTAQEHVQAALALGDEGRWHEAIAELDQAIRLNPHDADFYPLRAFAHEELGEYQQAIHDYGEAIRLNPQDADLYWLRAFVYEELAQYQQAIDDYGEAIRLSPQDADLYLFRALDHEKLGHYEQAIDDYGEAIRLSPQDTDLYLFRALDYEKLGRYQQAIDDYGEAIRLSPQDTDLYLFRALDYEKLGQYQQATDDYSEAIRLNPQDANAHASRGFTHYVLGEFQRSIEDLDEALRIDSQDAGSLNNRALVHAMVGNFELALADADRALELRPTNNLNFVDTRAFVQFKSGDYENAKLDYEELFSLEFQNPYTLLGGGLASAGLGENERAKELLEQGLAEAGGVSAPDPQLADLIAMAEEALSTLQ